jgi:hypothetical protein
MSRGKRRYSGSIEIKKSKNNKFSPVFSHVFGNECQFMILFLYVSNSLRNIGYIESVVKI